MAGQERMELEMNGMEWNYAGEGNIGQLRLQFVAMIRYIYDTHMSSNTEALQISV